ncbi:PREDICTED: RHOMBOID-like protein 7 isoform X2 [Tarenaya hassleriana]|uniref:RHOMBOID-like protein 7 isoform X2 n=1 Tax=Tarenaya hassleriana TaxID=28532 RepID=UPI00053C108E|nr:PREDICTED: RHOMBOID-like protein 7 isoform X2 [Tarenaya hassleriana]
MAKEDVERGRRERDRGDAHGEISDVQSTSWVIPAVVISNVVVFVVVMYVNDCPGKSHRCLAKFLGRFSFESFKENPLLGPSSSTLIKMGALAWWKVVQEHQGWRLVTCMWLHAGVIHLVANMLCVAFIGVRLEQQFGFVRIGTIYLVSGFCGSILSSLFLQHSISVGASGALFGLLGAMLSELLINWTIYVNKVAALIMLLVIVGVNLALGTLPRVDNFAHIGGFLGGFLLGFVLLMRPQFEWEANQQTFRPGSRVQSKYNLCQCMLCLVAAILFAAGFAFGLVMLFRGVNLNSYYMN